MSGDIYAAFPLHRPAVVGGLLPEGKLVFDLHPTGKSRGYMKTYVRLCVFAALIGAALATCALRAHSFGSETLAPAAAQADFDLMRKALEEAHSGLYRYSTKAEMDRMFLAERAKLNHPTSKIEFAGVLFETLAQIRCGHTGMTPDEETAKEANEARMLPLRMVAEGRRWLVVLFN